MIRGLAVGEIRFKDLFRVIFKEIRIALIVGVVLSVANGIRILCYVSGYEACVCDRYHDYCDCLYAKVVGCVLPLVARGSGLTRH